MKIKNLEKLLAGGDLRSIGKSNTVANGIENQEDFDDLFRLLFHKDRIVVMRTADAIEKISANNYSYLEKHKTQIIKLCELAIDKELKWHLALLVSRLKLSKTELERVSKFLLGWARDKKESRIVRVNSLQGIFNLLSRYQNLKHTFDSLLSDIEKENVPSLNARIKKFKNVIRK